MEINERITKAKVQIQMKSSFFAYLSLYLKIKKDNKIPTACINAKGEMYYNEKFFDGLNDLELQGTLLHEIFHLAFLNLTRVGTKDHTLWNYATDLANNTMLLKESKYELPDGCLKPDHYDKYEFKVDGKNYEIEKVSTKRADELYYELLKMKEEHNEGNKGGNGEKGEENGENGQGSPFDDYKGFDKHDYNSLTPEEIKEAEENWTEKMAEAVAISKMKGDCPAGIEKMFDELHKEEIDWKAILQRIVTKEIPYDYTYCLERNTPIYTPRGIIKIKDLRQGRYVLGYKNGKVVYSKIKSKFKSKIKKKYTIKTKNGKEIICSEKHRFLTVRGYVRADELTKKDKILGVNK